MKIGQNFRCNRQIRRPRNPFPNQLPVIVVQAEQGLKIMPELNFFPHGKKEPVYQEYDCNRSPQINNAQGDGSLFIQGHAGHSQGVTGGENRLVPGSRSGTIHQGNHHQSEPDLPPHPRKNHLEAELQEAADQGADGPGFHAVTAVLMAGLNQQKRI